MACWMRLTIHNTGDSQPKPKNGPDRCPHCFLRFVLRNAHVTRKVLSSRIIANAPARKTKKGVISPKEFQALLEELSVRDRAIVLLAGSTGLRRSEMIALTGENVNAVNLEVTVLRSCVRNRFGGWQEHRIKASRSSSSIGA